MKKIKASASKKDKSEELMKLYISLGFNSDQMNGVQAQASQESLAPVSFLPHVDYTISSRIGA